MLTALALWAGVVGTASASADTYGTLSVSEQNALTDLTFVESNLQPPYTDSGSLGIAADLEACLAEFEATPPAFVMHGVCPWQQRMLDYLDEQTAASSGALASEQSYYDSLSTDQLSLFQDAEASMVQGDSTVLASMAGDPLAAESVSSALADLAPEALAADPPVGAGVVLVAGLLQIGDLRSIFVAPPVVFTPGHLTHAALCSNHYAPWQGYSSGTDGSHEPSLPAPCAGFDNGPVASALQLSHNGNAQCVAGDGISHAANGQDGWTDYTTGGRLNQADSGGGATFTPAACLSVDANGDVPAEYLAMEQTDVESSRIGFGALPFGESQSSVYCPPQAVPLSGLTMITEPGQCNDSSGNTQQTNGVAQLVAAAGVRPAGPAGPYVGTAPIETVPAVGVASAPTPSKVAGAWQNIVNGAPSSAPLFTDLTNASQSPAVTVPDCYSVSTTWEHCSAAIAAVGLTPVQEDANSQPCACGSTSFPSDEVEGMSQSMSQYIEADGQVVPSGTTVYVFVNDPPATTTPGGDLTAPSCQGVTVATCEQAFRNAGFTGTDVVTWVNAVTCTAPCDSNAPTGYIVKTSPYQGAVVTQDAANEVLTFYGAGLVVPAPAANELTTQYVSEVHTAGFATVTVNILSGDQVDPFVGPDEVAHVVPQPGQAFDPANEPDVNVDGNPDTAPAPLAIPNAQVTPPSPFTGPTIDPNGLDFPNFPIACGTSASVFPFGVPCWIISQAQQLDSAPIAPHVSISTPFGPINANAGNVDGYDVSTVMTYARPLIAVIALFGLAVALANLAMRGAFTFGRDDSSAVSPGSSGDPSDLV